MKKSFGYFILIATSFILLLTGCFSNRNITSSLIEKSDYSIKAIDFSKEFRLTGDPVFPNRKKVNPRGPSYETKISGFPYYKGNGKPFVVFLSWDNSLRVSFRNVWNQIFSISEYITRVRNDINWILKKVQSKFSSDINSYKEEFGYAIYNQKKFLIIKTKILYNDGRLGNFVSLLNPNQNLIVLIAADKENMDIKVAGEIVYNLKEN